MLYSELLARLKPHGIEQVGRLTAENDSTIYLARPREVCFPFQFQNFPLYAPAGVDEFELSRAEVEALERRFKISILNPHPGTVQ